MNRHASYAGIALCFLTTLALAAPEPELIPFWNQSDESNTANIAHDDWQGLLDNYLSTHASGINRVNYAALKANREDLSRLNSYLAYLQSLDPRQYTRDTQKAFWINLYNALTVKTVTEAYPVDSIKEIHESWLPNAGPWQDVRATIVDQPLTLDDIEHGILRPIWQDPRIHYAVNCASLGCPNLASQAYTTANLESLLDQGAREYINHARGVDVVDVDFLVISSIYDWFIVDFGDSEAGVIAHLLKYANDELTEQLKQFDGGIDYDYDWALNQPDA